MTHVIKLIIAFSLGLLFNVVTDFYFSEDLIRTLHEIEIKKRYNEVVDDKKASNEDQKFENWEVIYTITGKGKGTQL
jgi:hypothetical protein